MDLSLPQLRKRRRIWFKWFVLSVGIFFASAGFLYLSFQAPAPPAAIAPAPTPTPLPPAPEPPSTVALCTALASFVTALVALVGFIYTSLLTWRKEKRETLLNDLEVEKRRLENEKLRRDLDHGSSDRNPHLDL
ncbi:hypothetical protein PQR46_08230 [Paraburkholderia sediminicola]|uniref:hypothetical protein n=1 Tax=Paraburkholderia TaxID=1822464 RepID=UPI0038B70348